MLNHHANSRPQSPSCHQYSDGSCDCLPRSLGYPKHPLPPLRVDEEYYEEFLLVKDRGIPCSLFNLEAFEVFDPSGRFRPRPEIPTGSNVLYRGWMMHPERYEMLVSRIEENGAHPITSNSDYMRCHHLPGWYDVCKDLTAETIYSSKPTTMTTTSFPLLTSLGGRIFLSKIL